MSSQVSLARNTEPKPPLPKDRMISYLPTFCPWRNMSPIPEMGNHPQSDHEGLGTFLIDLDGVKLV